jgi:hypothetical protein
VTFPTVSIDTSDTVFFTNKDNQAAHWPSIAGNQVGAAPSPNSSECIVPYGTPPSVVAYTCKLHAGEKGTINVFAILSAGTTSLADATVNTPIAPQQVVQGGMCPYAVSEQLFQITNPSGGIIQSGSGSIGPGLVLTPSTSNNGISVSGTPTVAGTYQFTFTVNDGMGKNLQQVQYTLKVA